MQCAAIQSDRGLERRKNRVGYSVLISVCDTYKRQHSHVRIVAAGSCKHISAEECARRQRTDWLHRLFKKAALMQPRESDHAWHTSAVYSSLGKFGHHSLCASDQGVPASHPPST